MAGVYETLQDEVEGLCFREHHYPAGWPRHPACPCCESSATRFAFRKWGVAHDVCRRCRFVFMNPYPTEEFLTELYNAGYMSGVRRFIEMPKARAGRTDALRSMAEEHYTEILDRLTAYRSEGAWLDVGGGIGTFLHRARARLPRFETYLSEMSRVSAEFARDFYGLTVLTDPLEELRNQGRRFDVITIIAVLEHLTHPRRTVQAVLDLLAPGGILLILVPNFTRLNRWLSHGASGAVTAPYHVSLFNRHNLPRMIRRLGPVRVREVWESGPPAFFWIHLARITDNHHLYIPRAPLEQLESVQRTPYTARQVKLIPRLAALDNRAWMRRLIERWDGKAYLNVLVQNTEASAPARARGGLVRLGHAA
jgi:2-polyprenyl-3-methyl-5-hydroxy-6-metoxy-1,4-benzoquinol methylase